MLRNFDNGIQEVHGNYSGWYPVDRVLNGDGRVAFQVGILPNRFSEVETPVMTVLRTKLYEYPTSPVLLSRMNLRLKNSHALEFRFLTNPQEELELEFYKRIAGSNDVEIIINDSAFGYSKRGVVKIEDGASMKEMGVAAKEAMMWIPRKDRDFKVACAALGLHLSAFGS